MSPSHLDTWSSCFIRFVPLHHKRIRRDRSISLTISSLSLHRPMAAERQFIHPAQPRPAHPNNSTHKKQVSQPKPRKLEASTLFPHPARRHTCRLHAQLAPLRERVEARKWNNQQESGPSGLSQLLPPKPAVIVLCTDDKASLSQSENTERDNPLRSATPCCDAKTWIGINVTWLGLGIWRDCAHGPHIGLASGAVTALRCISDTASSPSQPNPAGTGSCVLSAWLRCG